MAANLSACEKQLAREIKNPPKEYLPNLLQIVRLYRESVELKPAAASFRQGWKEAWKGGKPLIKPLKPRKWPARIADAVLEDRG